MATIDEVIAAINGGDIAPQEAPQDPVAGEFTWESAPPTPQYNPGQWGSSLEDIGLPNPGPATPPTAPRVAGVSQKASFSGTTPQSRATARGFFGEVDRLVNADMAGQDARFDQERKAYAAHNEALKSSLLEQATLERDHNGRLLQIEDRIRDYTQTQADLERRIHADGVIERQKILAEYSEQLAGVRALAAQTGNPLHGLGFGQAGAMGGALFAQGFLAAQGIHIDVAGQIDKWVDRSIQEHQMNIQNARQGAQDQLHLYEIARQVSADDYEARERFRGFVVEGFKAQIRMEAARFGSSIALARADQRAAELDLELEKINSNIGDRRQQAYVQAHSQRLQQVKAQADMAHQQAMLAETRRYHDENLKLEREKMQPKVASPQRFADPAATIRDTAGKILGVRNGWEVKAGATPKQIEAADKVNATHGQAYAIILKGTAKLRDLRPPAMDDYKEKFGIRWVSKYSEARREYDRQVTHTIQQLRHDIAGAALTKFEANEWLDLLPPDSMWQEGNNAAAIDQLESASRDKFVGALEQTGAVRVLQGDEYNDKSNVEVRSGGLNDTDARYDASIHGQRRSTSEVDKAVTPVVDGSRNEVKKGGGYSPAYLEWRKSSGMKAEGTTDDRENLHGQHSKIDAIDHLVSIYVKPSLAIERSETVDGKPTLTEDQARRGALSALRAVAAGQEIDGRTPDDAVRAYAKYAISEISNGWTGAASADELEAVYRKYASRVKLDEDRAAQEDEDDIRKAYRRFGKRAPGDTTPITEPFQE